MVTFKEFELSFGIMGWGLQKHVVLLRHHIWQPLIVDQTFDKNVIIKTHTKGGFPQYRQYVQKIIILMSKKIILSNTINIGI